MEMNETIMKSWCQELHAKLKARFIGCKIYVGTTENNLLIVSVQHHTHKKTGIGCVKKYENATSFPLVDGSMDRVAHQVEAAYRFAITKAFINLDSVNE